MARPSARRKGRREEPEEETRGRGRGSRGGSRKAGPNPATMIMGGVVAVLLLVAVVVLMNQGDDKPKTETVPLGPAPTEKAAAPKGPTKEPPKPLTASEIKEVDELFDAAEVEMREFRTLVKKGWTLKNDEDDEEGANDAWVEAKKHYKSALRMVNEVMEDEDRFPEERQKAFMGRWLERLGGWSKEASDVPKVHD